MQPIKFHKISWKQYEKDCIAIARKIKNQLHEKPIDVIVAISRGGLVAARILSDLLNLTVSHMTIVSYQDLKQQKEIKITETPNRVFDNHSILLIDEIGDSGRTFSEAKKYFTRFKNCSLQSVALYIKSHTNPLPDYWVQKIDAWIIFPYEIRETTDAFLKMFKSKEKAKEKLLEVGFEEWELEGII